MRVQLRDLTPGTEYAIQFRSNNGDEVSEWSQVQRFTTTNDTIPPAPVTNLSWGQSGGSFIGTWDKPTKDAQGNNLFDFRDFQLEIDDTVNAFKHIVHTVDTFFALTEDEQVKAFGSRKAALRLTVKVRDLNYNESSPVTLTTSADTPPVPDKPTVGNYLGMLNVIWNGKAAGGAAMPESFSHAEVHIGTSANFTPDDTTYKTRIQAVGSTNSAVIPGLAYGTLVYVRLVAVSKLNRKSGPSASTSGTPDRVSGLDITNGSLSAEQINWTATTIPGQNAYYSTSQPTVAIGGGAFKVNDLWYDTDNAYTVYKWNGTAWVLAPEVGFIPASKLVAGTITGDRIAANFFTAARAYLGQAFIDEAMIQTVNAASITTGSLQVNQRIIAGPENDVHAEVRDTGFYVYGPGNSNDPLAPPVMNQVVKMGTDDGDTFSIQDPNSPDETLAAINVNGQASFQSLDIRDEITVGGRGLQDLIEDGGGLVGHGYIYPITGLNQSGAQGIRNEYGIGQFTFPVQAGRSYRIDAKLDEILSNYANPYVFVTLRYQQDLRTQADINAGLPATPVTNSSPILINEVANMWPTAGWTNVIERQGIFESDFTGYVSIGFSLTAGNLADSSSVIKVIDPASLEFVAVDVGKTLPKAGKMHSQGGTLYSWTAPQPAPPAATQQYLWTNNFNWVHSYAGSGAHMSNSSGRAYQGQDPSGYNGNQSGLFGFSNADWTPLANKRVDKITLYLYFPHWYYAAGGTARIGFHSQFSDPGTANRPVGPQGTFDVGGWPRAAGKEIDITGWAPYFKNGAFRGIYLGPGNNGYQNYGYATTCTIKVWWTG